MASTLKKNSCVSDDQYNNFILQFRDYYRAYRTAIKKIVDAVTSTVMVQNIWTDQYAADFAFWFNDEAGVVDGSDQLNKAIIKMEALFKTTCLAPVKDVVKLTGTDILSTRPMIKKAYNAKDIYGVLEITKYRKANFGKLNLKRKSGWKVVTNAAKVNSLINEIEKNIKIVKDKGAKIQTLLKKCVLTPGTRCIEITNFNNSQLTKAMSEINTALTKFETKSTKMASKAITELNVTIDSVSKKMGEVVEDFGSTKDGVIEDDGPVIYYD